MSNYSGEKRPRVLLSEPTTALIAATGPKKAPAPISNWALNRELLSISPNEILALFLVRQEDFNDINCATALARLSRSPSTKKCTPGLLSLISRTAEIASGHGVKSKGKTLTSQAHSLGVFGTIAGLETPSCTALQAIAPAACAAQHRGDPDAPGAISTVLWALGTLRWVLPDRVVSTALFAAAASAATQMSAAELSNAAWGTARAGVRSTTLMTALGKAATSHAICGSFTAQGIASTAWAWAKLKLRPPNSLYVALVSSALKMLDVRDLHEKGCSQLCVGVGGRSQ